MLPEPDNRQQTLEALEHQIESIRKSIIELQAGGGTERTDETPATTFAAVEGDTDKKDVQFIYNDPNQDIEITGGQEIAIYGALFSILLLLISLVEMDSHRAEAILIAIIGMWALVTCSGILLSSIHDDKGIKITDHIE